MEPENSSTPTRMTPKTAGMLGMLAGLAIAVVAGFMIASPPYSIVGAVVLVAATILFAVASTWSRRESWDAGTYAAVDASDERLQRNARRWSVVLGVILVPLLGVWVWLFIAGEIEWWSLANVLAPVSFFLLNRRENKKREAQERELRRARKTE